MRDDAAVFPVELYVQALGDRAVRELRRAKPRPWAGSGCMADRFLLNGGALAYWLWAHFQLNIFNDADCPRIDADPLSERIRIAGEGEFAIPHWCYLPMLDDPQFPSDPRPHSWPGIPKPEEQTV